MSSASIGIKLGRGLGKVGALAVEGVFLTATSAGKFGADVVTGVETGYAEKREQLVERRIASAKKRSADLAEALAAHKLAMEPAVEPATPAPAMKFAKRARA